MRSFSHIYNAAAYARASKDDADSSTIENQIGMIRDYASAAPGINIVSIRKDNGFSGVDLLRPAFAKMMRDIEAGEINCVIVKDLSRLGRNYIEVGELIDGVFPRRNVRLISINDNYDSLCPNTDADEILIPFKNLINEQYLRDSSMKIRSGLNIKRKNGEFVAAFAPYGYKRDENDIHKLAVDGHAAEVVRRIFRLKLEGMSGHKIAKRLTAIGEPSPAEYKKRDTNYTAQFQTHNRAAWSAVAVGRILKNPVYIGTLIQGKITTPNYKVKRRIKVPESKWHITANAHEPIISAADFETVNSLLLQDTRAAPGKDAVYPLSGMIYCGDCENNMVRTKSGNKYYYVCASSRSKNKSCTSHCVQQRILEEAVTKAVALQIAFAIDAERCVSCLQALPSSRLDPLRLHAQIDDREREIEDCLIYKRSLYEDCRNGVISESDFIEFSRAYTERIAELKSAIDKLREEAESLPDRGSAQAGTLAWLMNFIECGYLPEIDRRLSVSLIDRIDVYSGKRVAIRLRCLDRFDTAYTNPRF